MTGGRLPDKQKVKLTVPDNYQNEPLQSSRRSSKVKKWSRRDSNPCPNMTFKSFLHAYFRIVCREWAGAKQTNPFLS